MFLATATCMPVNGTVVPRSSETFVAAAAGAGAGAGALAAGLPTAAAAVTSVAAHHSRGSRRRSISCGVSAAGICPQPIPGGLTLQGPLT